jgi:hypothetical protein
MYNLGYLHANWMGPREHVFVGSLDELVYQLCSGDVTNVAAPWSQAANPNPD